MDVTQVPVVVEVVQWEDVVVEEEGVVPTVTVVVTVVADPGMVVVVVVITVDHTGMATDLIEEELHHQIHTGNFIVTKNHNKYAGIL